MEQEVKKILQYFPKELQEELNQIMLDYPSLTEIRLRQNTAAWITANGASLQVGRTIVTSHQIEQTLLRLCGFSMPAFEDQLSNGFLTIEGGHRIGVAGEYIKNNQGKTILKRPTSLNIRIAKQHCFFDIPKELMNFSNGILVCGPPHSGKTTLLRTLAKQLCLENMRLVICDERQELFVPMSDCDYISGIKKAEAIQIATRTLNPQVVICDEIGSTQESQEILSATNTGVKFICSAHAQNLQQMQQRPNINLLLRSYIFDKIVFLQQKQNQFYIKEIIDV